MNRTIDFLIDIVCIEYDVSRDEFLGTTRRKTAVLARQCAFFCARRITGHSYHELGNDFQGSKPQPFDHTTIIAGRRRHLKRMNAPEVKAQTERIIAEVLKTQAALVKARREIASQLPELQSAGK